MQSLTTSTQIHQTTLQKITFTQQLAKNISLLAHNVSQLRHDVLLEVTENPALEIKEEPDHDSIEAIQYDKYSGDDANKHFEFIESLLISPETLHEYLIKQLHLNTDNELEILIGERIIANIDEHGFYTTNPEVLCNDIPDATMQLIEKATHTIQSFDPIGCATQNTTHSINVQIEHLDIPTEEKKQLHDYIHIMLEEYENNSNKKKQNENLSTASAINNYLHMITPYPGLAYNPNFTPKQEAYIIPDATILISENNEIEVHINNDIIPIIDIKKDIEELTKSENKQDALFANKCIQAAQSFLTGLKYRTSSLEKVISFIAHTHFNFFTEKEKDIKPLTRKDIASALALNESTVSRIVTGKYIQTPCGIFEIKHFLSHSIGSPDISMQKVENAIQSIITQYSEKRPSDEKIKELLAEKGIYIARRTVAKYRKKLEAKL